MIRVFPAHQVLQVILETQVFRACLGIAELRGHRDIQEPLELRVTQVIPEFQGLRVTLEQVAIQVIQVFPVLQV